MCKKKGLHPLCRGDHRGVWGSCLERSSEPTAPKRYIVRHSLAPFRGPVLPYRPFVACFNHLPEGLLEGTPHTDSRVENASGRLAKTMFPAFG